MPYLIAEKKFTFEPENRAEQHFEPGQSFFVSDDQVDAFVSRGLARLEDATDGSAPAPKLYGAGGEIISGG
jgi:hypothetical protein